jgi:hypothetical protein
MTAARERQIASRYAWPMIHTAPEPSLARRTATGIAASPFLLWVSFVLAHLWLGWLNLNAPGLPLGDVELVYKFWSQQVVASGIVVGVDTVWVYPIVAIVPMLMASVAGFAAYASTWLSLVFLLDAVAFSAMVGWRRSARGNVVGWWWVAFLVLLGPIAMGRIDSITIPLAIVAVLLLARHPRVAALLLTIATWIKVWPAAIIAAVIIASSARRRVIGAAVATSVSIIAIALALGSGENVFSFITQQTGRGLQVEAPVSTIWMWLSLAHVPGAYVYYDQNILTYQVAGPGAEVAAQVMTPILALAVVAIAVLGILATRRGTPVTELLAPLALAFITAFIAFNKVGSPQYMTWLAVPVILGLATSAAGHGRSFRTPVVLVLMLAALTQVFYPYVYVNLLELNPLLVTVLTARNILLFVLLVWAMNVLWDLSRRNAPHENIDPTDWLPTVWPLGRSRVHDAVDEIEHGAPAEVDAADQPPR